MIISEKAEFKSPMFIYSSPTCENVEWSMGEFTWFVFIYPLYFTIIDSYQDEYRNLDYQLLGTEIRENYLIQVDEVVWGYQW